MNSLFRPAVALFALLSLITGVAYPLVVTAIARAAFPRLATGSIIIRDGRAVGSALIGQDFTADPALFWGRPSSTGPAPYTAFNAETLTGSTGSNLGPTNAVLVANVGARLEALRAGDLAAGFARPAGEAPPIDLVTASASGLDPHVSVAAARYQAGRVAAARGLPLTDVLDLIRKHTRGRDLGILGEPVVNILELNLSLVEAAH